MQGPNFNMEDPAKQEAIRRKSHAYVPTEGVHGRYVEKPYLHQEYPKVMDSSPAPQRKQFASEAEFETAFREWDNRVAASTVHSKSEEAAFRKVQAA